MLFHCLFGILGVFCFAFTPKDLSCEILIPFNYGYIFVSLHKFESEVNK